MLDYIKNELKNYDYYKESLKRINDSLSYTWHELAGVKAIRYDKQPGSYSKAAARKRQHELMDKIEKLETEASRIKKQIVYIEGILTRVQDEEIREAILKVYTQKKTLRKVAKGLYMSHVTLYKQINKQLEGAIRDDL